MTLRDGDEWMTATQDRVAETQNGSCANGPPRGQSGRQPRPEGYRKAAHRFDGLRIHQDGETPREIAKE